MGIAPRLTDAELVAFAMALPRDRPRVMQRILALTATIRHNDHTGRPVLRSVTAYDH